MILNPLICALKEGHLLYKNCVYASCISRKCNTDNIIDCDACIPWHFFLNVDSGTYYVVALPISYYVYLHGDNVDRLLDSIILKEGCYYNKALYTMHIKSQKIEFKKEQIRAIYPVKVRRRDSVFLDEDCWYCECRNKNLLINLLTK